MELASLGFLSLPVSFHFRTLFHSGKSSLAHLQRRGGPGLQVDGGHQRRGVRRQHRNKQNQRKVRKKDTIFKTSALCKFYGITYF